MKYSVAIVGAGRVGRALARGLRERGWKIGAIVATNLPNARRAVRYIGAGRACAGVTPEILDSRVILIAAPDDAVELAACAVARACGGALRGKIVLHTSGALDSSALAPVREQGAAVGSMHPLQTFNGVSVPPLEGRIFTLEGDGPALRTARQIARSLGAQPVVLSGANKLIYHAAAVMAAGHVLALEEAAVRLLMSVGMKRQEALRGLLPLTRQVLDNFERLGPRVAWTGPLSRGDFAVVAAHIRELEALPAEYREAYIALSRLTARVLAGENAEIFTALDNMTFQDSRTAKAAKVLERQT
jgi:predicted short-subunit dehydrogenase-like oxidoreductase (DUF2520 family)